MAAKLENSENVIEDEDLENEEIVGDEETGDELEESVGSDTLKPNSMPVGPANKSAAINKIVNAMVGMDMETINKFVASISQIGHEADSIPADAAGKNKSTLDTKPSGADVQLVTKLGWTNESVEPDVSTRDIIAEDVSNIFEGESLSEEFKEKVTTIIESTINLKADQRIAALEEQFETMFEDEVNTITENLVETVDDYLTTAVEEWLEENRVAVESSIKNDLADDFIESLKALLETHYITVPEDRIDVIEEMNEKIDNLEKLVSEKMDENDELKEALTVKDVEITVAEMARGLTDTDTEKLYEMASSVDFDDIDDFKGKVEILKEQYFSGAPDKPSKGNKEVLFEEVDVIEDEESGPRLTGPMSQYVNTLTRTSRK